MRRASGAVLCGGVLFTTDIPTQLAASAPGYVSAIQRVERSHGVAGDLRHLTASAANAGRASPPGSTPGTLRNYGPAPDFAGITGGSTRPASRPLTLSELRGKVVLVDFWTYSCVNCIRTLPYLKAWYARYHRDGLVIVGVHTPEFAFEHVVGNVAAGGARARHPLPGRRRRQLRHVGRVGEPVLAGRLPDRPQRRRPRRPLRRGRLRADAGRHPPAAGRAGARGRWPSAGGAITPRRASRRRRPTSAPTAPRRTSSSSHPGSDFDYGAPAGGRRTPSPSPATGRWSSHQIVAGAGAHLLFRYMAPRIYLVAAPPAGGARHARRHVDGSRRRRCACPTTTSTSSPTCRRAGPHLLDLAVPPGTTLYSFTFG